ncbi:MAG: 16S rRNA (guanine(527)-N(7))-methyltransferase RsmG [Ktedonobacteraceae bacterium]
MGEDKLSVLAEGLQQLGLTKERGAEGYESQKEAEEILLTNLLCYRKELLEWNTRFNLTAITDPEEVLQKHFLDSLSLLQIYNKAQIHLLDVGSGAGFPGLPLKIARPDWHVTLIEATGKKTLFLRHIIDVLGLKEIEVIHGRAEEIAHRHQYRSSFDIVTARAVASLSSLLEYCAPYCRTGGFIILPKKGNFDEELARGKRAAVQVGAVLSADHLVELEGLKDGRRLLIWEQVRPCPAEFPRNGAVMAKKPLG